ncbi:MAG: D-alanyl-D-alanine carboxypeptidase/D-alanyl-D-alanine-endopeptidase [Bacteroidales bacterium]|nr:D-alanyl-D-alanine carboxypeptidase/D-alanyl-D-alanine-endopeptidase [Bacteroidales bacterium]
MRHKIQFFIVLFCLCAPALRASTPYQQEIEAILTDSALQGASVGICAETLDGVRLVDIDSDRLMVPSSNLKLITTGAALHYLGKDYQFKTRLAYSGTVKDSTLTGNLYIIGGADPTLGSVDVIAAKEEALFGDWGEALLKAGIRRIRGEIIGDGSYLDGMKESPLWQYDDIGTYYGSGVSGLQWHENYISLKVSPGDQVGDSLRIEFVGPRTPWMNYHLLCRTGERGSGDQVYLYTNDGSRTALLKGTFGLGKPLKNIKVSNKFPERTCAFLFNEYLLKHGFSTRGYNAFDNLADTLARPKKVHSLCETASPSLKEIIRSCNNESNNVYAETLLRVLGKEMCQSACYDSSLVALDRVLLTLGISGRDSSGRKVDGIIRDGSGLARHNLVSAGFFCRFLRAMADAPCYKDYLTSLPQPGLHGTVQPCLRLLPSSERRRVKMKSGSMTGIRCYSGYITPAHGDTQGQTIVFSLLINNTTADQYQQRALTDKIISALLHSKAPEISE